MADKHSHGWLVKTVTSVFLGACPNVKVIIGDVEVDQHFFIQEGCTYPDIPGEPYITSMRMETKVVDNGSAYAKIRSQDGRHTVQFMTVQPNHERNREELKEHTISTGRDCCADPVFEKDYC